MNKIPLIKVSQRKEEFYLTKIKVRDLKKYTVLNFRYPYIESLSNKDRVSFEEYIEKLNKKNLNLKHGDDSVQRQLNIDKVSDLSKFIQDEYNFLPNTIILGCFTNNQNKFDFESISSQFAIEELNTDLGIYTLELNSDIEFTAIDGQHRLAGLFTSDDEEIENLEIPVVLLFNISLTASSKIFLDINSNQKSVDKSLMYDLLPILNQNNQSHKLKNFEVSSLERCHQICVTFYKSDFSPFFKQIRMLGYGGGAISQAFFVDQIYPLISSGRLSKFELEKQANILYLYFESIRSVFPQDWPVLKNDPNNEEHANLVLNKKKSQLSKTLGVGAFLKVLPHIIESIELSYGQSINGISSEDLYSEFKNRVRILDNKIIWSSKEYEEYMQHSTINNSGMELKRFFKGTNKASINELAEFLKEYLL